MFEDDQETCSLTLRTVSKRTSDVLYEAKALTGEPICRLMVKIVGYWVENDPEMQALRTQQVQQLANEYSRVDTDDGTMGPSGFATGSEESAETQPRSRLAHILKSLSTML